jgi:hypothetical protein
VDDVFELLDARGAQAFLQRFPSETKRKGDACFRAGRVHNLVEDNPGTEYSALVQDGGDNEVHLLYEAIEGWHGHCSCARQVDCEHVFAGMNALLAEYRTTVVRRLSASVGGVTTGAAVGSKSELGESGELARRLMVAAGRSLNREEKQLLGKVEEVYRRCRQTRQMSYWDFQQMGFPLVGHSWDGLKIWPAFPSSDYEFWLYVANTLEERGLKIPEFMVPVTDLGEIQASLRRWRRKLDVEKWERALGQLEQSVGLGSTMPVAETDLRLVVRQDQVWLEWLRPGHTEFEPVKQTHFLRLSNDHAQNRLSLTTEAELIWQIYTQRVYYGAHPALPYGQAQTVDILGRLLHIRLLDSRIVDIDGQPLQRPADPLRWELLPAVDEKDDYRLRLVQADGAPPLPCLCVLPGHPTLYLTAHAVFAGPDQQWSVLAPTGENCIPAPALERPSGVAFLKSLGVELPPRLRDRIRILPYEIIIRCELNRFFPASGREDCAVEVRAEAPDGTQQVWTGHNWAETTPKGVRRKQQDGVITLHDSAALAVVPPLLEPLNLKQVTYGFNGRLGLRVTKKFPEIFSAWLKTVPPQVTVQLLGELASFTGADVAGSVKLDVTEAEIDWFDLRVVLDVADTTLSKDEIKLLLNAKGGYVRLAGKGWRRLQFNLSEEENERLAELGLSPRELSAEPQRLHALQLADAAAKKFLPEQQVEQIQRRAGEIKARVSPDLPAGVTALLRPYQIEGFHFLAYLATNRFGGILADDMGLGKTLQALAWLLWMRSQSNGGNGKPNDGEPTEIQIPGSKDLEQQPADGAQIPANGNNHHPLPSLVVCPKSVMDNWQAEAAQFTPGLRVKVWGPSELGGFDLGLAQADLHVLNYSQLRLLGKHLAPVRWQAVILDEGQYIKNPTSLTAQAARALRTEHRLVLSGTPIENRLLDLWSLMAFAMPGVLGHRAQFARLYDAKDDPFARRRLASRVRPFVLRRTKLQVAKDLPDRVEKDLLCEIDGEQRALYHAELKRAQQLLLGVKTQSELAKQQFHFLTSLLRLRQICCDPRLMKPDSKAPSAKLEALLEHLESLMEEGEKVLVFSQFVEMLDLLRPALAERGWPIFYLAGSTENRGDLVRNFQTAPGPGVFLISLKAGGFGLNLTAASYVVLFDPWWNPAVENQAIDRTHRIGQNNKVIAYRLLIKNSIEEKIRALQKQKKALAEDVLGEAKFAQSLTLDDLRFLFASDGAANE